MIGTSFLCAKFVFVFLLSSGNLAFLHGLPGCTRDSIEGVPHVDIWFLLYFSSNLQEMAINQELRLLQQVSQGVKNSAQVLQWQHIQADTRFFSCTRCSSGCRENDYICMDSQCVKYISLLTCSFILDSDCYMTCQDLSC